MASALAVDVDAGVSGTMAVAVVSMRGGSEAPKLTSVQVPLAHVCHCGSISVTSPDIERRGWA